MRFFSSAAAVTIFRRCLCVPSGQSANGTRRCSGLLRTGGHVHSAILTARVGVLRFARLFRGRVVYSLLQRGGWSVEEREPSVAAVTTCSGSGDEKLLSLLLSLRVTFVARLNRSNTTLRSFLHYRGRSPRSPTPLILPLCTVRDLAWGTFSEVYIAVSSVCTFVGGACFPKDFRFLRTVLYIYDVLLRAVAAAINSSSCCFRSCSCCW